MKVDLLTVDFNKNYIDLMGVDLDLVCTHPAHQSSQECSHKQQTDSVSSISSKDDPDLNAEGSAALDLLSCESISYKMRQNIPGVTYMKDGCEGWTPVVSR